MALSYLLNICLTKLDYKLHESRDLFLLPLNLKSPEPYPGQNGTWYIFVESMNKLFWLNSLYKSFSQICNAKNSQFHNIFMCYQVPDTVLVVLLELVCIYLPKLNKTCFDHNNIPVNCHLKRSPMWGAQAVTLTPDMTVGTGASLTSTSLSLPLEKQITEYLSLGWWSRSTSTDIQE